MDEQKKYTSLKNLQEYNDLIKEYVNNGDVAVLSSSQEYTDSQVSTLTTTMDAADADTLASAKSYADSIKTDITSGDVIVKEAEHATSADTASSADTATSATTADTATKATQDASGNVIVDTYETKTDAQAKYDEAIEHSNVNLKAAREYADGITYVSYNAQTLTTEEQRQARTNIGAASADIWLPLSNIITEEVSSRSAKADISDLFPDDGELSTRYCYYNDTNYNMIQFVFNDSVFIITTSLVSAIYIKLIRYTDANNYEVRIEHTGGYVIFKVVDGVTSKESGNYVNSNQVLLLGNNVEYIPTTDYSPATKKYVDDSILDKVDSSDLDNYYTKTEVDSIENSLIAQIENIDLSVYETTTNSEAKLAEAKVYADSAASTAANNIKNDILNGAGEAYDTLKELGDLINENVDAIDALESVATGKADKSDVTALQELVGETAVSEQISTAISEIPVNVLIKPLSTIGENDGITFSHSSTTNNLKLEITSTAVDCGNVIYKNDVANFSGTLTYMARGANGIGYTGYIELFENDFIIVKNLVDKKFLYLGTNRHIDALNYDVSGNFTSRTTYAMAIQTDVDNALTEAKSYTDESLTTKADVEHSHDDLYYTKTEIDASLSGKADSSHTHDDRYYTETEMDTKLAAKSDTSHNHDSAYDAKGSAAGIQANLDVVSDELDAHTSNNDIHFTSTERTKLTGIETGAQKNTITGVKGNSESSYRTGNVNITPANIGLGNVNNTSDANKPVSTAQQTAIDAALEESKTYTDTKTSSLASTSSVSTSISTHNTSTSAHSDIRALITNLTTKLNNFLDVDDTTTDQLSEVLTLIENNKGTLESLTSSKVNVSDIVNNLTTNSTSKVLSAAQGVAIKALIDALQTAVDGKSDSSHSHTIKASASDDDVIVLTGTNGTNEVTYSASHANSGVTAGTYKSVTVNAKGHVTSGSNPTTLSGYGITDAYTKTQVDTSLNTKAAQTSLNSHTSDTTAHITSTERTDWNDANSKKHAHSNKTILDNTTASYTTAEQSKLSGIAAGAQVNQNAFSNITVGSTTVAADSATDTVTFVGSNLTITPDATNDKITFTVADGTTSGKGIVQLTNSTSSTSTTTAATPNSVKSAYDLANTANTNAATAQTRADSAYTLADGKVDSLSDLGITATATELNYTDGVTSNIQTQLDNKVSTSRTINGKTLSSNITLSASDVGAGVKNTWYGTCPTAQGTVAKVVTTNTEDFSLTAGNIIYVLFTYAAYNGSTLNVDGTGAIAIKTNATTGVATYQWTANEAIGFVYDGTYFRMLDGMIANTTYYGMTKLSSSTNSTSTALAATPSAVKAAYDLANTANTAATTAQATADGKAPMYTYGTEDLTAGTSELATGVLYFVYE